MAAFPEMFPWLLPTVVPGYYRGWYQGVSRGSSRSVLEVVSSYNVYITEILGTTGRFQPPGRLVQELVLMWPTGYPLLLHSSLQPLASLPPPPLLLHSRPGGTDQGSGIGQGGGTDQGNGTDQRSGTGQESGTEQGSGSCTDVSEAPVVPVFLK